MYILFKHKGIYHNHIGGNVNIPSDALIMCNEITKENYISSLYYRYKQFQYNYSTLIRKYNNFKHKITTFDNILKDYKFEYKELQTIKYEYNQEYYTVDLDSGIITPWKYAGYDYYFFNNYTIGEINLKDRLIFNSYEDADNYYLYEIYCKRIAYDVELIESTNQIKANTMRQKYFIKLINKINSIK